MKWSEKIEEAAKKLLEGVTPDDRRHKHVAAEFQGDAEFIVYGPEFLRAALQEIERLREYEWMYNDLQ